jgi:hypothetical protein
LSTDFRHCLVTTLSADDDVVNGRFVDDPPGELPMMPTTGAVYVPGHERRERPVQDRKANQSAFSSETHEVGDRRAAVSLFGVIIRLAAGKRICSITVPNDPRPSVCPDAGPIHQGSMNQPYIRST